ncbi:ankyrin repeat protein [Colletotrichum kahawae]|uniref:Ankyrin repeat protein n=1 Tax=Colletotrichum kahawae TaxID=34407 RepID=A0AAD9Y594_COLKA|nr:ankyrin repeat protein [Colletotrichum kahawae]
MVPRRRKSAIDQREWDQLGSVIRNLYLEEDRALKDVLVILRTVHNFQPSKSQLEWKLKQWHMTKNPTSTEWRHVISEIDQRLSRGKESQIYLSGIPLRPASIKRARGRHCYESAIERTLPRVEPPSPMDISVIIRTPSPEGQTRFSSSATLPWFQARQALQGASDGGRALNFCHRPYTVFLTLDFCRAWVAYASHH